MARFSIIPDGYRRFVPLAWSALAGVAALLAWLVPALSSDEVEPAGVEWVQPNTVEESPLRLALLWQEIEALHVAGGKIRAMRPKHWAFTGPKGTPKWFWTGPMVAELNLGTQEPWVSSVPNSKGKAETTCIWAHPPDKGELELSWSGIPATKLHAMLYFLPGADEKAGVAVKVSYGGKEVAAHAPPTRKGKPFYFEVDLKAGEVESKGGAAKARGGDGTLTVAFTSRKGGRNHICFDGLVVPDDTTQEDQGEEAAEDQEDAAVEDGGDEEAGRENHE